MSHSQRAVLKAQQPTANNQVSEKGSHLPVCLDDNTCRPYTACNWQAVINRTEPPLCRLYCAATSSAQQVWLRLHKFSCHNFLGQDGSPSNSYPTYYAVLDTRSRFNGAPDSCPCLQRKPALDYGGVKTPFKLGPLLFCSCPQKQRQETKVWYFSILHASLL